IAKSLCWRQCGKTGDHTHIFWDCPVILAYWKNIKLEMEKIVKREVPSNVRFFLLGVISVDVFNADQRYILRVLLLIAKKNITANWKSVKSPTVTE
uniref:Reverse transcriptase zinc-binding domain-containing protein n=1 Tax=Sander lucioperca TaxID=283035 RepID=A0A8D0AWU7_SANLU